MTTRNNVHCVCIVNIVQTVVTSVPCCLGNSTHAAGQVHAVHGHISVTGFSASGKNLENGKSIFQTWKNQGI